MELWFNPRCSKCRVSKELLDELGVAYDERRYLDDATPSRDELTRVLDLLGMQPWELARLGEPVAASLGLDGWPRDATSRDRWIDAMVANPILIERPILVTDDGRAVVGRPPERIVDLLRDAP